MPINPKVKRVYEDFLNPEIQRPRLISASLFIAGFEIFKNSIVDRICAFFWRGHDESGDLIDPKYQADVLSRNRSPVYASLSWLQSMRAIDEADLAVFERVKRCRNRLAHELPSMLDSGLPDDFYQCFGEMLVLLRKVEVWWIATMEVPSNPEFDGVQVNENEILPGAVMSMNVLMQIALGDESESRFYYDEFRKRNKDG